MGDSRAQAQQGQLVVEYAFVLAVVLVFIVGAGLLLTGSLGGAWDALAAAFPV